MLQFRGLILFEFNYFILHLQVAVDTVSVMQPAGYPVVTDSMFTFRTPIFQDSATFQFFIEVTADDNNVSNAYQQRPLSGVILLIVACLICYTCH